MEITELDEGGLVVLVELLSIGLKSAPTTVVEDELSAPVFDTQGKSGLLGTFVNVPVGITELTNGCGGIKGD